MKKTMWKMMALFLAVWMLLGGLIGCAESTGRLMKMEESERAMEVYRLINKKMDTVKSYSSEERFDLNFKISDYKSESYQGVATVKIVNADSQNLSYETKIEVTTKNKISGGGTSGYRVIQTEGFQNGKMFIRSESQELDETTREKSSFCSDITAEEYKKYLKETATSLEIKADSCTSKTCVHEENGDWKITFSEFSASAMTEIALTVGNVQAILHEDLKLTGVTVTMVADKDFVAKSLDVVFTTDFREGVKKQVGAEAPVVSISVTYFDVNSTQEPERKDFDGFTKVDDLRVLKIIEKAWSDRQQLEKGTFTLTTTSHAKQGREEAQSEEVDNISFATNNGKFSYTIDAEIEQSGNDTTRSVTIKYADGKKTVKDNGKTTATDSDDETEKKTVYKLSICEAYNRLYVQSLKKVEEGVYAISLESEVSGSYTATLTVTLKDGVLTQWTYLVEGRSGATFVKTEKTCVY